MPQIAKLGQANTAFDLMYILFTKIFPCLASKTSKITKETDVRKQANVINLLHHFNCKILVQWHSWESLLYSMHAACTQKNMFSQKKRLQLTTLLLSDSLLIPEPHNLIFIMLHWAFQTTSTLTCLHLVLVCTNRIIALKTIPKLVSNRKFCFHFLIRVLNSQYID